MERCNAWLLEFGRGERAALGQRELIELLYAPATHSVPFAPTQCPRILFWGSGVLPVLNLDAVLGYPRSGQEMKFVGVVGFQTSPDEPTQFAALVLAAPPVRIEVSDEDACPLPEKLNHWRPLACSCFEQRGAAIPVLDLQRALGGPQARATAGQDHPHQAAGRT